MDFSVLFLEYRGYDGSGLWYGKLSTVNFILIGLSKENEWMMCLVVVIEEFFGCSGQLVVFTK